MIAQFVVRDDFTHQGRFEGVRGRPRPPEGQPRQLRYALLAPAIDGILAAI